MPKAVMSNRVAFAMVLVVTLNLLISIQPPTQHADDLIDVNGGAMLSEIIAGGGVTPDSAGIAEKNTDNDTVASEPHPPLDDAISSIAAAANVTATATAPSPTTAPTMAPTEAIANATTTASTVAGNGAIRPPPSLDLPISNTSSACLIWMDDTQRLVEWIAYHYFTFNLRTLVIFRDPQSTQHLQPLIARWEGLMNITVWHNLDDFARDEERRLTILKWRAQLPRMKNRKKAAEQAYDVHIANQEEFYRGCSMYLQERNRTWSFFIDTDEIIVLNSITVPNASDRMAEPGSLFDALQQIQHHNITNGASHFERPCITTKRTQLSSFESPSMHVRRDVPDFLDPYRFQTLRFRHVEGKGYAGKAIADVSKLNFVGEQMSVHRLLDSQCPLPWGQREDIFHINHYIGTFEAFLRPNDNRKGLEDRAEKWRARSSRSYKDRGSQLGDEPRSWIRGFVNHFGKENSMALLQDAGSPFNRTTALRRIALPCRDKCMGPFHSQYSLLYKIEQKLQASN